jgi:solute carrier family 12 (sodium/potassium/chloride transporter), member 2
MAASGQMKTSGYQFGWFKGVYTPSVLTIFGVIMYLRFGWVLGNLGLSGTLLVVLLANLITFITALSLSALSTNMKVGGGGAYFMISRSLGLEPGAAIGLPLFLAQALGVSFYVAGFSESFLQVFPVASEPVVGVITLVVIGTLAYISANLALKSQFVIMAAIALSLVSLFIGQAPPPPEPGELLEIPARLGFWTVFAVFFPAVTGIEAGISMSGDLKNPARALPTGTIAAVLSGLLVYIAIPIFLNSRVEDPALLLTRPLIMRDVARYGSFIVMGVWGASLSSAMGSILGAPRTLQALSRDGVAPRWLGKGFGQGNDPRIATAVVFIIALTGILAGGLNLIGPVLSMFFLTSYGFLNLSAGLETLIGSPTWRPQFKVWWGLPLLGSLVCMMTMLMINTGATFIAVLVCGGIYAGLRRRRIRARWGDMRYGILMLMARYSIYGMAEKEPDERSWKPNILVLSGPPAQRWHLVDLAEAIAGDSCLMTVAMVLPEDFSDDRASNAQKVLREHLARQRVPALVKTLKARDPFDGGMDLIGSYGFGPLVPNTILIGETRDESHLEQYSRLVLHAFRSKRNIVIVREGASTEESDSTGGIDVWWRGRGRNAGFMLAIAHLIAKHPEWKNSRLRINVITETEEERQGMEKHMREFLEKARLDADYNPILTSGEKPFDVIRRVSSDARLVILGLRPPMPEEDPLDYSIYYRNMQENTFGLPLSALVFANEEVDFQSIFS